MQIKIPQLQPAPLSYNAPRKITPLPGPAAIFLDEVGMDEEKVAPAPSHKVNLGVRVESLFREVSPTTGYVPERGLYFVGRRPSCTIIGLGRSNFNLSNEVYITPAEHILQWGKLIRENEGQPYTLFVIDAFTQDVFSAAQEVVQETQGNRLYFNHKPVVSVVEKGAEGLLSRLQERYSDTPLRFIEARKYGTDVIDAQLFGQPRY